MRVVEEDLVTQGYAKANSISIFWEVTSLKTPPYLLSWILHFNKIPR